MATALFIDYVQLFEMGTTGLPANFGQLVKTPLADLKIYFLGPHFFWKRYPFHSKMGPHFDKYRSPLHVGAVHYSLDKIWLFQFNLSLGNLNSKNSFVVVNRDF